MNLNGSHAHLNHLITLLGDPQKAPASQVEFNQNRRRRIASATNVRPVYIPLQFTMDAAGRTNPYRQTTAPLGYDVIISGAKADVQTRDIVVRRTESESSLLYTGNETSLFLRVDEIAGQGTTNGGGQSGVFQWPSPIHLKANQRFTVEMFKTDTTADVEVANITLVGFRVYPNPTASLQIDARDAAAIELALRARTGPIQRFLKHKIDFDSAIVGGVALNVFTPQVDEPLLIRGVRTTLRQTTLQVGLSDEPMWSIGDVPCWAIAAEDDLIHDNYHWFPKPIYLGIGRTIVVTRAVNGNIDKVNLDAQTGNTITWICDTV